MDDVVRLEGFHAVKHALRFGARLRSLVTPDPAAVEALRARLAPDLDLTAAGLRPVDAATWAATAPRPLPSPLLGEATRPPWRLADVAARPGPVVVVERPRHLGNLGAVVRVAAAAGAAGVVVVGDVDPFHPRAVRGAAGLHWALPVVRSSLDEAFALGPTSGRRVVALDERGEALAPGGLPDAVVVLGTERHGLSTAARERADVAVRIPMRPGVASLNVATAAAVALYVGAGGPG